jgi:hypothetical protein
MKGKSVDENGDENGLRVKKSPSSIALVARSRQPKWQETAEKTVENALVPYDLNQSHLGHDLNKRHLNRSSQRSRRKFVIPPEAVKNNSSLRTS